MPDRIAYLPLDTQSDPVAEAALLNAIAVGAGFGCKVHVTNLAVNVPPVASPLGGFMINVEGMARAVEERSRAACQRQTTLIAASPAAESVVAVVTHEVTMGGAMSAAVAESRQFDLSLVAVPSGNSSPLDMAQALVFDSGLPVILVPEETKSAALDHLAIAWDGSRVAARALNDALRLLQPGGRMSVLTVRGEKALAAADPAGDLAAALRRRGYDAHAATVELAGGTVAEALQTAARGAGAKLLAMGGFGHSRLRDFILGGATLGVLSHLQMPVLLSH